MNHQDHLKRVLDLFSAWRAERKPRQKIPDKLWSEALELSKGLGVTRTCQELRLNQGTFKLYREKIEGSTSAESTAQDFLELPRSPLAPNSFRADISIELPKGRRVDIRLEESDVETASRFLRLLISDS